MTARSGQVFFGGPDKPAGYLRDLLKERVEAVGPGGSINWMTYYFRDERLAEALVRAQRRGVSVRLCLERAPRMRHANDQVVAMLAGADGIGGDLKLVRQLIPGRLHTKLYCFSDPQPHALVGSFNPSGNEPEDAAVVADLGDQDRGHNLLVEIAEPELVLAFVERVAAVHRGASPFGALAMPSHSTVAAARFEAFFYPRWIGNPLEQRLADLGHGSNLRIAASHVSDRPTANLLTSLAGRGVDVHLLTHHTLRRVPYETVQFLRSGGVRVNRYEHPHELPMHAKFILARHRDRAWLAFGSYNLKRRSRWLNQELLMFSSDRELWDCLDSRWNQILSEPWCHQ